VHLKQGLWNAGGGFEYNLVLIAAVTAVVAEGPGALSLDALARRPRWGSGWGLAALAAGVAGSSAVVALGTRHAAAMAEPTEPAAGSESPDEASGAAPAGGDGGAGGDQVTDSAAAAEAQGLDPAQSADASI
jgi:putative oxidoreductase